MSKSISPGPFAFSLPTTIIFGAGRLGELRTHAAALGVRPVLVTGRRSARASGVLGRVLEALRPVEHIEADENPTDTAGDEAAARVRAARGDCVIALGGGSAIDLGKTVAGLALNDGPCTAFFGTDTFTRGTLPLLAIPTTAGAGSEATPYAVLTCSSENTKRTISGRRLFPQIALLDPELTRSLPAAVTAHTGLDALSQAMEGFASKKATPMGDVLALEACRRICEHLPRAVQDGSNLEARSQMLHAALLAGCVIAQSGTTLVHGMGYGLTLECGIAHGYANALLLAPVFRHNAFEAPERMAMLCAALGRPVRAAEPAAVARSLGHAVHDLIRACGLSPAARDAGLRHEQVEPFAARIMGDPYRFRNQIGAITRDQVLEFLEKAHDGRLD